MKKLTLFFVVALLALFTLFFATGCAITAPSTTVIKTIDPKTGITTETTTNESAVKSFLESTKGKLVFINNQGWAGGVYYVPPASDATNPAGVLKMFLAKEDCTYMSVPMEAIKNTAVVNSIWGLAGMISAARSGGVSVSSSGISSTTPEAPTQESSANTIKQTTNTEAK